MKTVFLSALLILSASAALADGQRIAWILRVDSDSEEIVLQTVDTKETIVVCGVDAGQLGLFAGRINWITSIRFEPRTDKEGRRIFGAQPRLILAGEEVAEWLIVAPEKKEEKIAKRAP